MYTYIYISYIYILFTVYIYIYTSYHHIRVIEFLFPRAVAWKKVLRPDELGTVGCGASDAKRSDANDVMLV